MVGDLVNADRHQQCEGGEMSHERGLPTIPDQLLQGPMNRRRFLIGAGVTAAGLGLAACGGNGAPDVSSASTSAGSGAAASTGTGSGPITIWAGFQEIQQEAFFKTQYLDPWNKMHPKTPLELTVKPTATMAQLQQTAVGAGQGPDILTEDGVSQVIPLAEANQLLPLDKYAKANNWDKLLLPWAIGASSWNGKLWSVPTVVETMIMYYNPATFDKYNWKPPTNLSDTEAFLAEAKGRGLQPIASGNAGWRGVNEWWVTMFWNHYSGPDALYQALTGKIKWTDPVFVEPLQILQDWFKKGWIGQSSQDYFTTQFAPCYTDLANGKAATYWSGSWEFANLHLYFGKAAHNTDTYKWANLPQLRSGIPKVLNELSIGGTYGINAKAKDPDGVAAYLSWYLTNVHGAAVGLKEFGNEPPPIRLTPQSWVAGTDPNFTSCFNALIANSKKGDVGYTTWTFWPPKSDTYIIDAADGVINGSTKPADYCAGLQKVFEPEFKAGRVPGVFKPGAAA
jgi:raffinose/stachyose/melibiose transport system substrate-binding protein